LNGAGVDRACDGLSSNVVCRRGAAVGALELSGTSKETCSAAEGDVGAVRGANKGNKVVRAAANYLA
jgi:hypothetical protein